MTHIINFSHLPLYTFRCHHHICQLQNVHLHHQKAIPANLFCSTPPFPLPVCLQAIRICSSFQIKAALRKQFKAFVQFVPLHSLPFITLHFICFTSCCATKGLYIATPSSHSSPFPDVPPAESKRLFSVKMIYSLLYFHLITGFPSCRKCIFRVNIYSS